MTTTRKRLNRKKETGTTILNLFGENRMSLQLFLLILLPLLAQAQQASENPLEMYGGSVLAMASRDAVVLVTDTRLGRGLGLIHAHVTRPVWGASLKSSSLGLSSLSEPPPRWIMTATGLPGDIQSLQADMQAILQQQHTSLPIRGRNGRSSRSDATIEQSSYSSSSCKLVSTRAAVQILSHLLYQQRRYLVQPILVGFVPQEEEGDYDKNEKEFETEENKEREGDENKHITDNTDGEAAAANTPSTLKSSSSKRRWIPWLCTMDMLGATSITHDYAATGAAAAALLGSAAIYYPHDDDDNDDSAISDDDERDKQGSSNQESSSGQQEQQEIKTTPTRGTNVVDTSVLLEAAVKAFLAGIDRNILSGYGVVAYVLHARDGRCEEYQVLTTRND